MQNVHKRATIVFGVLVAAVAFYTAMAFWWALGRGEVFAPDLVRPIAYAFVGLFGILFMLRLIRDRERTVTERNLLWVAIGSVLVMPLLYYYAGQHPRLQTVLIVAEWVLDISLLAGLAYFAVRGGLSSRQRFGAVLGGVAFLLEPYTPWYWNLGNAGLIPGDLWNLHWVVGPWIATGAWCLGAALVIWPELPNPKTMYGDAIAKGQAANRRVMTVGTLIGLGLSLIGMNNSVANVSHAYTQYTYVNGQLSDTSIVSLTDMNGTLLIGMGIVVFCLLLLLMLVPAPKRTRG